MHMKEMYFHEIAVYRVPISIKKIKSFSNNNRNFLEKITSFFKNVLIFGGFI